jgi:hypothetical protein
VSLVQTIRRRVPALDAATVVVIFGMALYFARPLLEEWGVLLYFRAHGIHSYVTLASGFPLRPLQVAPNAIQAALFGYGATAFALTFGLLLVGKYVALRWAVGPYLPARLAWMVACMGTALIPWTAGWRGRYAAGELSAIFLFVALGAVLRSRERIRITWFLTAGIAIGLMLATYQALALCAAALPLVALLGLPPAPAAAGDALRVWARRCAIAWAPVVFGGILYGIYSLIAVHLAGSTGYEGIMVGGTTSRLSVSGAWEAIPDLYRTAYQHAPWTLPLFAGILALVAGGPLSALADRRERVGWTVGLGVCVLLLPLLSLTYIANVSFFGDPDRLGFPVAVGFVLLVLLAVLRFGDEARSPAGPAIRRQLDLAVPVVVAGLLLWMLPLGKANRIDYQAENVVLTATANAARAGHTTSVVVEDQTGTMGDIYSLYQSAFWSALALRGSVMTDAVLCTPAGVDRVTPAARSLGVSTTARCEDVRRSLPKALVLQVVAVPGGLTVIPGA